MHSSSILKLIPKNSIFGLLPDSWENLEAEMSIELVSAGETIYRSGEMLDKLLIPLSDDLKLVNNEKVNFLQKGRTLGLGNILSASPIPYDVVTGDANKLLVIPLTSFLKYLNDRPKYKQYLQKVTLSSSFRNLKNYLLEKGVEQDSIIDLAEDMRPWTATEGVDHKLIFVESGESDFIVKDENTFLIENSIRPGIWFGSAALINARALPYEVPSNSELEGFSIELKKLKTFFSTEILEYLSIDPWVGLKKKVQTEDYVKFKNKTKLNVKLISFEEAQLKYKLSIDNSKFLRANDDLENISRTIFNSLCLFNKTIDFTSLNQFVSRTYSHLTWSAISSTIENFGFVTRATTVDLEKLSGSENAFYFYIQNRLVCCLKIFSKDLLCVDAIDGLFLLKKKDILKDWNGTILSFKSIPESLLPQEEVLTQDSKRRKLASAILSVLAEDKKSFVLIGLLTLFIYGISSLIPQFSQVLLDEVLRTEDDQTLLMCIGGILVSAFSIILFTHLKNLITNYSAISFDQKFSTYLYKNSLELSPGSLAKIEVGGVINRLSEAEKLRQFFSIESVNSIMNLGSVVVYSAILLTYSPSIIFIPAIYFLLMFVTVKYYRKKIYKHNLDAFNLSSRISSFIGECVSKVLAIKAFGARNQMANTWDDVLTQNVDASNKAELEAAKLQGFTDFFSQLTQIGTVWLIVYLLFSSKANFSIGEIFAITQYIQMIVSPLGGLVDFVERIEDVKLSLDKLADIFFPSAQTKKNNGNFAFDLQGKIKLERVGYKYQQDGPWILRDISLTIYPGQIIALVGKSGSGKTTLANIIAREAEATTGRVFYDDYDVSFLEKNNLKSQIGYIQQNNELFSGAIRSNVAYKDDSPSEELLHFALKNSNSDSFVSSFPQGDKTYLAEGGMGLSGGQKQRLSIARVLYMNPKVIIMDEATSALDSESEMEIVESMKEISKSRTSILIAHRLSTIRSADLILVVDKGTIVQQGHHNDLIKVEGIYKELFQDQAS